MMCMYLSHTCTQALEKAKTDLEKTADTFLGIEEEKKKQETAAQQGQCAWTECKLMHIG